MSAPRTSVVYRVIATIAVLATLALLAGVLVAVAAIQRTGVDVEVYATQMFGQLSLGISFTVVGWLVATRRSGNPLGWIYLAIGVSQVGNSFATAASYFGLVVVPGSVPGADVLSWVGMWSWDPGFGLLISFSILLFPDGRLPSRRWRAVAIGAVAAMALMGVPTAIAAWPMRGVALTPANVHVSDLAELLQLIGVVLMAAVGVASIASIAVRFRRADGRERAQLSWFLWAAAVEVLVVVGSGFVTYPPVAWLLTSLFIAPLLPVAIGIAIFRYRLYELDRIVSRTVGWAIVTGVLVAVFAAGVVLLQAILAPFTQENTIAVAASTLIASALFQPLRRGVQRAVDRRFDRARYDGQRTADAFATLVRDDVDLGSLRASLAATAAQAVRPTSSSVWLSSRGARCRRPILAARRVHRRQRRRPGPAPREGGHAHRRLQHGPAPGRQPSTPPSVGSSSPGHRETGWGASSWSPAGSGRWSSSSTRSPGTA